MRMLWLANPLARRREIYLRGKRLGNGAGGGAAERPGGEPSPPLASAASRRVGPCTRSVVQRSCTGGPGAASASVTPGRRANSERSGPSSEQPIPSLDFTASLCFDLAVRPFKLFHALIQRHPGQRGALDAYREFAHALQGHQVAQLLFRHIFPVHHLLEPS